MGSPRHGGVVPGHHIYAYCHIHTNQVLYSLTRTLQNRQLKQLPDSGANNNPPKLRKDVWRPLWSLQLPRTDDGRLQGLHAYRMLLDFRQRHEMSWEPPKSLSIPFTAKQIEKLEKRLEDRGGSKKESPYDLIARKKFKTRVQMVMDQKTNSIADLAAVLLHQDDRIEEQSESRDKAKRDEAQEMEVLAALWHENDGQAREELEAEIKELKLQRNARQRDRLWRKLHGELDALKLRLAKMRFAAQWVPQAKWEAELAVSARAARAAKALAESETGGAADPDAAAASTTDASEEPASAEEEAEEWRKFLPSFPSELTRRPLSASHPHLLPSDIPRRNIPAVYSAEGKGITVHWANTLDAEYAAEWPALVKHVPMGIVRNTAPRADAKQPFLEFEDYRAAQWKHRRDGVEPTLAEKVQARRSEMEEKKSTEGGALPQGENPVKMGKEHITEGEAPPVAEDSVKMQKEHSTEGEALLEGEDAAEVEVIDPAAARAARQKVLEDLRADAMRSARGRSLKQRQGVDAALNHGEAASPEVRA